MFPSPSWPGSSRPGFDYALPLRCLSASHWPFNSLRRNGVDARIKSGHDIAAQERKTLRLPPPKRGKAGVGVERLIPTRLAARADLPFARGGRHAALPRLTTRDNAPSADEGRASTKPGFGQRG